MDNSDDPNKKRRISINLNDLDKAIRPSAEFQKQLQRLVTPSAKFVKMHSQLQDYSKLMESFEPLRDLRNRMAHFNSVHDSQIEEIRKNINLHSTFAISKEISDAIKGITINPKIFELNIPKIDLDAINRSLDLLNQESSYLGEYEIIVEDDGPEKEEPRIGLPDPLERQYSSVNFLPITIQQKILQEPEILYRIDPRDFEYFVADLIAKLGFDHVNVTERSGDGGRDILATKLVNDIPLLFAFECKRYAKDRKIQLETMRALLGTVSHSSSKANIGVLVTTSTFTSGSKKFIASEAQLDGKDFNDLVRWINKTKW